MKVTIEEYIPEEEKHFIDVKDGKLWSDRFYDPKRQMYFHVMKEPDWIHFEFYKTYEIKFIDEDDGDFITYHYRLAARLNNNTLIVSEYYNKKWYTRKEDYIPDNVERIDLFEYIDKHTNSVSFTDPSLKYMKGESEDDV